MNDHNLHLDMSVAVKNVRDLDMSYVLIMPALIFRNTYGSGKWQHRNRKQ